MKKEERDDGFNIKNLLFSLSFILIALLFILIIPASSASLDKGNPQYSIEKRYGISQNITGWINVSTASEEINSLFSDSLGRNISLIDLVKQNSNAVYNCMPKGCGNDYSASSPQT
mgnify:FL=1